MVNHAWLSADSTPINNDGGEIAYSLAYRIEGASRYLRLAPTDSAAWRTMRRDVKAALAARDSERHLADYRGVSGPVWSGIKNRIPDGTRSSMLVDNGIIAAALINAARRLETGDSADRKLASACLRAATDALHAFDADLREDSRLKREYYIFPLDVPLRAWEHGRVVPMNYLAAAALAWYRLAQASRDSVARKHARLIGNSIAAQMWLDHGAVLWKYQTESVIDDVAHAGIVATYVMQGDAEFDVGGEPVRNALALTLARIFRVDGDTVIVADHIDGTKSGELRLRGAFSQWAEVLPVACELYPRVAASILSFRQRLGAQAFVGAAALLEAAGSCAGAAAKLTSIVEKSVSSARPMRRADAQLVASTKPAPSAEFRHPLIA
ncbi:MAG: hypothetical protein ACJ796_23620 [Gemmatimonadaceae bacterium]